MHIHLRNLYCFLLYESVTNIIPNPWGDISPTILSQFLLLSVLIICFSWCFSSVSSLCYTLCLHLWSRALPFFWSPQSRHCYRGSMMDLLFRISWVAREKTLYHTPPSKTQLTPAFFLAPGVPVEEPALHLPLYTFSTRPLEISRHLVLSPRTSQVALVVKNLPADARAGDIRDAGSVPVWGRPPGEGNGNPLRYSCLGNPTDRGAWWATVHGVAQSHSLLKRQHACTKVP